MTWSDALCLTGARGKQHRRAIRRQLEGVAVAACHDHRAFSLLLGLDSRSEKIISFIARGLRIGEAQCLDKFWYDSELL